MDTVAFIVNLHTESDELIRSFDEKIRNMYPISDVLYISDGIDRHDVELRGYHHFSDRLKWNGRVGEWIHRYFSVFLEYSKATTCIKIDPDTVPVAPMDFIPPGDVFCAKMEYTAHPSNLYHPHAGVIGFDRNYIQSIVDSNELLSDRYKRCPRFRSREEFVLLDLFSITHATVHDVPSFRCGKLRSSSLDSCTFIHA